MIRTPYCHSTCHVEAWHGIRLRPIPNRFDSHEARCEFYSFDLPNRSDDDLHRDLIACDLAIRVCAPHADPWYFARCRAIRLHLEGRQR